MNKKMGLVKEKIETLKNRGAFHVILGSFATKFVSFFGSIFLVRLLTKQEYGILSYFENIYSYFVILAGLGLAAGILRYIVLSPSQNEKFSSFVRAIKHGSRINIILLIIASLLVIFYPHPEAFVDYIDIGLLLLLCIPFVYCNNLSLSSFRGLFDNKNYAVLSFITAFILIVSRVIGAAFGGLYLSVYFRIIAEIACALFCVVYIKRIHFKKSFLCKLDKQFVKEMDKYSLQVMFTDGLWAFFMLNDLFLLGQIVGEDTVIADYKVAFVIPANLSILTAAIGIFVAPYFTKFENEGNYDWIRRNIKRVVIVSLGIIGIASLLCFIFARPLILFLYGENYLSAVPLMQVLLIASFFNNGLRQGIANILSAVGEQLANLYVAGVGIVIQIVLDIMIIPRYGSIGLAWVSSLVYFIMGICLVFIMYRKFFLNIKSNEERE